MFSKAARYIGRRHDDEPVERCREFRFDGYLCRNPATVHCTGCGEKLCTTHATQVGPNDQGWTPGYYCTDCELALEEV